MNSTPLDKLCRFRISYRRGGIFEFHRRVQSSIHTSLDEFKGCFKTLQIHRRMSEFRRGMYEFRRGMYAFRRGMYEISSRDV